MKALALLPWAWPCSLVCKTPTLPPAFLHTLAKVRSLQTVVFQLLSPFCGLTLSSQKAHELLEGRTVLLTVSDISLTQRLKTHLLASLPSGWRGFIRDPAGSKRRKDLWATRDPRVPGMLVCLALESDSEAVTLTSDRRQLTMGVSSPFHIWTGRRRP